MYGDFVFVVSNNKMGPSASLVRLPAWGAGDPSKNVREFKSKPLKISAAPKVFKWKKNY